MTATSSRAQPETLPAETDVLVIGAGPAGAAAAAWSAEHGLDVVLADKETFPRDKPCGDGLTPRAIAELDRLGLTSWLSKHPVNQGLRACGFGQELYLPWPGGSLPGTGSAVPRTELDDVIRAEALNRGAVPLQNARAVGRIASRSPASDWWWRTAPVPSWAERWDGSGTAGRPTVWPPGPT